MQPFQLHQGDCLETLRGMADCSVDSIVSDPPYGLSFMGKKWDYDVPGVDVWSECLRVLKPGGHMLAFAGTRTQHRMAVRIEDAGFEIRDMIAWVYGSGFPKSLDVSKAIDKAAGARGHDGHGFNAAGIGESNGGSVFRSDHPNYVKPEAVTDAARQWQGWGTALKPSLEPITVARKPLIGTVAANVLQHGTGALNIDGCRVGVESTIRVQGSAEIGFHGGNFAPGLETGSALGRWPANLILSDDPEVLAGFPDSKSGGVNGVRKGGDNNCMSGGNQPRVYTDGRGPDTGSASRFFKQVSRELEDLEAARFMYCAKASKADRNAGTESTPNGNNHNTVKPTDLMAYLCRLVTPPGGIVLDPFMGSGSTGKAAMREGFRFIGCELSEEYLAIARARIEHEHTKVLAANAPPAPAPQADLFAIN